jgi:hypothetical protein
MKHSRNFVAKQPSLDDVASQRADKNNISMTISPQLPLTDLESNYFANQLLRPKQ